MDYIDPKNGMLINLYFHYVFRDFCCCDFKVIDYVDMQKVLYKDDSGLKQVKAKSTPPKQTNMYLCMYVCMYVYVCIYIYYVSLKWFIVCT